MEKLVLNMDKASYSVTSNHGSDLQKILTDSLMDTV